MVPMGLANQHYLPIRPGGCCDQTLLVFLAKPATAATGDYHCDGISRLDHRFVLHGLATNRGSLLVHEAGSGNQKTRGFFTLILAGPSSRDQKWSLPFYLGGGYTVRFIPNIATLTEYYNNANKIIFLSTNEDAARQVKLVIGSRINILGKQGEMTLMQIEPSKKMIPTLPPSTKPAVDIP